MPKHVALFPYLQGIKNHSVFGVCPFMPVRGEKLRANLDNDSFGH